jgi:hypothetical protein
MKEERTSYAPSYMYPIPPWTPPPLSERQKAKLHRVAAGLLEIYHTLARMRYLPPAWIHPGPHDLAALHPVFQSLALDPRIVYLYTILPYVSPPPTPTPDSDATSSRRNIRERAFFQGSAFADFRTEAHVREARTPVDPTADADRAGWVLRPWMTPLSLLRGRYTQMLLYDAKRDMVVVFCGDEWLSVDRNLRGGGLEGEWSEEKGDWVWFESPTDGVRDGPRVEVADPEGWKTERSWFDEEEDEEEDDDDEGEDEDEEAEQEIYWDEMDGRPAADVLRDVVRWYHELVETPGGAIWDTGTEWDAETVRALYRKHGWPGEDFDADAFVEDQARGYAARHGG